jgi:SAM-dependent methyltransferase
MVTEVWAAGKAYEPYIGRWSRLVAREFVAWLGAARDALWLDVGCGTGVLTSTILEKASPAHIVGIDASSAYAAFARENIDQERAVFAAADARALPIRSASVDGVVSGLVMNFVPAPDVALAEMTRVARPGGIVAIYLWDYAGEMQLIRHFWDAATELDSHASKLDEGSRFPLCNPNEMELLFRTAGLTSVESRAIDIPTRFRDFEDYWSPVLGGQGPAPAYAMSLAENDRERLRDHLRARLPSRADGSIDLIARAWAVRGVKS